MFFIQIYFDFGFGLVLTLSMQHDGYIKVYYMSRQLRH